MLANQDIRNIKRDPVDLRDQIYSPTLRPLRPCLYPEKMVLAAIKRDDPLPWLPRDQGPEGTCTGQALATLIDLQQMLNADDPATPIQPASARMLYEMARRQAPEGEPDGSTLRSVVKAFYHFGVCREASWPYLPNQSSGGLDVQRAKEARSLCLGAYFRLRPSLNDYHSAINEAGPVLVSAATHSGWDRQAVAANGGRIVPAMDDRGGHAFVVVGYDDKGFLVLNSWGAGWGGFDGCKGLGHWSYQDWADSVFDGWVLRLGVSAPGAFDLTAGEQGMFFMQTARRAASTPGYEIIGHMAHLDDGQPVSHGAYGYSPEHLDETKRYLTGDSGKGSRDRPVAARWDPSRPPDERGYRGILVRFGGSLLGLKDAVAQIAREKPAIKQHGLYPFTILWCSDFVEKTSQVLASLFEEAGKQVGARGDALDRLIEDQVHGVGRAFWRDLERGSRKGAEAKGAATYVLERLSTLEGYDLHIVAEGAGVLLLRDLIGTLMTDRRDIGEQLLRRVASLDLIAPTIGVVEFERHFEFLVDALNTAGPMPGGGARCVLHVPSSAAEERLAVGLYSKSILDLIENAFWDRLEPKPDLIGKSLTRTGLGQRWAQMAPFAAVAIEEIPMAEPIPRELQQQDLLSANRLLDKVLNRIAPAVIPTAGRQGG